MKSCHLFCFSDIVEVDMGISLEADMGIGLGSSWRGTDTTVGDFSFEKGHKLGRILGLFLNSWFNQMPNHTPAYLLSAAVSQQMSCRVPCHWVYRGCSLPWCCAHTGCYAGAWLWVWAVCTARLKQIFISSSTQQKTCETCFRIFFHYYCSVALSFYSCFKNSTYMNKVSDYVKGNTVRRNSAGFSVNFNHTLFKEIYYFYNTCMKGGEKKFFFSL